MKPSIISGSSFEDLRGRIFFNNDFNALGIKRIYMMENVDTHFERGWQGHKIEQRWFFASKGSFIIQLVKINNWEVPDYKAEVLNFELNSDKLDILHVPAGYASCIQAKGEDSRLVLLSDYGLGEIEDEYRFPLEYFKNKA